MNTERITNEEEISLSELYGIIKPYIIHTILIGIIFALASFLVTKILIDPVYESETTLIVNNRRTDESTITSDEIRSAATLADVYGIIIKSNAVMEPVVESINADLTMDQLKRKVSVSSVNNTQVIKISVKDTDPILARDLANEIIKIAPDIIVDMVEAGSAKVVSYPEVPEHAVSPNTKMNILVAGMLGVMLSVGFVFLRFILDKTFRNSQEIENYLGIPVIGVIPNIDSVKAGK